MMANVRTFEKRPPRIEAVQFIGSNLLEVSEFLVEKRVPFKIQNGTLMVPGRDTTIFLDREYSGRRWEIVHVEDYVVCHGMIVPYAGSCTTFRFELLSQEQLDAYYQEVIL
jgi:hypothetical protein